MKVTNIGGVQTLYILVLFLKTRMRLRLLTYCLQTKLWEGNVFTHVCSHGGIHTLQRMCIHGGGGMCLIKGECA